MLGSRSASRAGRIRNPRARPTLHDHRRNHVVKLRPKRHPRHTVRESTARAESLILRGFQRPQRISTTTIDSGTTGWTLARAVSRADQSARNAAAARTALDAFVQEWNAHDISALARRGALPAGANCRSAS